MKAPQKYAGGWQHKLQALIDANNSQKVSGRGQVSYRTREKRAENMFKMFRILREQLNYQIEDPYNLKLKHVEALVKYFIEEEYAPRTIDNYLSVLRTLCGWMGKPGMVKNLSDYAPGLRRTYAAQHDKSWSGNGVNFLEVFDRVRAKDKYVAMQLLLVAAFGARAKEAVMFKPLIAAQDHQIHLFAGTKGDRPRIEAIDDEFKRAVVSVLKNFVATRVGSAQGHIGHPNKTLEQNEKRYYNVLSACGISKKESGVTGHGLRAEFAIDEMEKRGLIATIRGGSGKVEAPMLVKDVDQPVSAKLATNLVYLQVSELLGHSRKSVMTAYGGRLVAKKQEQPDGTQKEILVWKADAAKKLKKAKF